MTDMDLVEISHLSALNAEDLGWTSASLQEISNALNTSLAREDLSAFVALLSEIARDKVLKTQGGQHRSISDAPYTSLLPREKHLLSDAFDLFLRLGLEFRGKVDEIESDPV